MCYRSKHGAITAWCATFVNITTTSKQQLHQILPNTTKTHSKNFPPDRSTTRGYSSSVSFGIYRCLLFLLLFAQIPGLVTAQPPTSMTSKSVGFNNNDYSDPFYIKQAYSRKRIKRKLRDRHPWTPDLVTYVCEELTDPCVRASFLRRHVEHEICSDIPPLYLLPHIDDLNDPIEGSDQSPTSSPQLCDPNEMEVRSSDGLYRKYLETPERCRISLETLDAKIRSTLNQDLNNFLDILKRSFCILANSTDDTMQEECEQCRKAYWSWICSIQFPIYYPLVKLPTPEPPGKGEIDPISPPSTISITTQPSSSIVDTTTTPQAPSSQFLHNLSTTTQFYKLRQQKEFHLIRQRDGGESTLALERIPGCITWCTKVETLCPYYNPSDATQNGGEPTFLCDESHYQYALPDDSSQSSNCEYGCCFTEQDIESDDYITPETPPSTPPYPTPAPAFDSELNTVEEALSADVVEAGIWNLEPSKEDAGTESRPVSLRERCFQRQLFTRDIEVSKFHDRTPPSSSFSFTLVPNAFLIVVLAAFLDLDLTFLNV